MSGKCSFLFRCISLLIYPTSICFKDISCCNPRLFLFFDLDEKPVIFTSEKYGNDENGDGSEGNPFKTVIQAMRFAKVEPFPVIMVDGKDENAVGFNNFEGLL